MMMIRCAARANDGQSFWEGPETRRVPRGGKAEPRVARAHEMSPTCRAREKRRCKKNYIEIASQRQSARRKTRKT